MTHEKEKTLSTITALKQGNHGLDKLGLLLPNKPNTTH